LHLGLYLTKISVSVMFVVSCQSSAYFFRNGNGDE
jgi:hypothetical protein